MTRTGNRIDWTQAQIDYVIKNSETMSDNEMAKNISKEVGITIKGHNVATLRVRLDIRKISEEDIEAKLIKERTVVESDTGFFEDRDDWLI